MGVFVSQKTNVHRNFVDFLGFCKDVSFSLKKEGRIWGAFFFFVVDSGKVSGWEWSREVERC